MRLSPSEWEIIRICWKLGRANYYTTAQPQKNGLQTQIDRFLQEVVGSERKNLELVEKAVARRLGRKTSQR